MPEENESQIQQEVEEFSALKTHAEKYDYFHAHPALAKIFRAVHFPKPEKKSDAQPAVQ